VVFIWKNLKNQILYLPCNFAVALIWKNLKPDIVFRFRILIYMENRFCEKPCSDGKR
jgi:hypothetical protein